jgi:hypothetical protein
MNSNVLFSGVLGGVMLAIAGCSVSNGENLARADKALAKSGTELHGDDDCAAARQVPEDCPVDIEWRNHGQFVSCVAKHAEARLAAGHITAEEKDALVSIAAQSDVGKKHGPGASGAAEQDQALTVVATDTDADTDQESSEGEDVDGDEPDFGAAVSEECRNSDDTDE